jgi:paraquat-inducible protein A
LDDPISPGLIACPDCDLLQQLPRLVPGAKAVCARCKRLLAKNPGGSRDLPLALTVATAISLVIANMFPLMDLHVVGRSSSTSIAGGAYEMWLQGEPITGVLVMFCAVIAPCGYVLFMLTLLLAARRRLIPRWAGEMLRWIGHLQVWSMLEVVMLGLLVALIKIAQLATVDPGIGMYAFGAVVFLIPATMISFDSHELWRRAVWMDGEIPHLVSAASAEQAAFP